MKRSAPLIRKTPLKAKASIKRGGPIKAKRKPAKPKDEAAHLAALAQMPCLTCGKWPVHVHHVHSDGYQRITRSDRRCVALCPGCHQDGPKAVHKLGHRAFNELHGVDLLAEADRLWDERHIRSTN